MELKTQTAKIFFTLLLFGKSISYASANPVEASRLLSHCLKPSQSEEVIFTSDFSFIRKLSPHEMELKFERLYKGPKRLFKRAYFDPSTQRIKAPIPHIQSEAHVDSAFAANVSNHIKQSLKKGLSFYPFFSDMGHGHFLIPRKTYRRIKTSSFSSQATANFYQSMTSNPDVKLLYHVGEQLQFFKKPRLRKSFLSEKIRSYYTTRNFVAYQKGETTQIEVLKRENDSKLTINEYPKHLYYGAFYFHANHQGCFSTEMHGKKIYFDISFSYFAPDDDIDYAD